MSMTADPRPPSIEQMCRELLAQAERDRLIRIRGDVDMLSAGDLTGTANLLETYLRDAIRRSKP